MTSEREALERMLEIMRENQLDSLTLRVGSATYELVLRAETHAGALPVQTYVDRVEVGQVLCILEAMKLMNEITSDFAGVVRRILPENGALVSLGEEMFWIEP